MSSKQSEPWVQELFDALVYSGPKWRPWLWWAISGAVGGAMASALTLLVRGNFVWGIPLILILFISVTKLHGLLERGCTARSIQRLFFFPAAFSLASFVPLQTLSDRYGLAIIALVICIGAILGGAHTVLLSNRVRRFNLWLVSGITSGALATVAGMIVLRLANLDVGSFQLNAAGGAVVGFIYCGLLGGLFLRVFWDPSCTFAELAYRWEEAERLPEAVAMCDLAIALRPDDPVFRYNRGTYHAQLGQYDEAFTDYSEALSLDPNDNQAYSNRGSAYLDLGDFDAARADYDKALSLNPNDAVTLNSRGNLHASLGDYMSAIEDFDRSIALDPTDAMTYSNRGAAYSKLGDVGRAIEEYGSAIEHNPDYANSYANRAFAYYKIGDYQRSLADCDQAVTLRPDHAASYSNRGLCRAALGDAEGAAADFRRALELPCPPVVREEAVDGLRALGIDVDE